MFDLSHLIFSLSVAFLFSFSFSPAVSLSFSFPVYLTLFHPLYFAFLSVSLVSFLFVSSCFPFLFSSLSFSFLLFQQSKSNFPLSLSFSLSIFLSFLPYRTLFPVTFPPSSPCLSLPPIVFPLCSSCSRFLSLSISHSFLFPSLSISLFIFLSFSFSAHLTLALSFSLSIPVSLALPPTLGSSLMRLAAPLSKRRRPSIGCVIDMDFCPKWWKICHGYSQAISPGFSSQEGKRPQQLYNWYGDQFSCSGLYSLTLTGPVNHVACGFCHDGGQMKWWEEDEERWRGGGYILVTLWPITIYAAVFVLQRFGWWLAYSKMPTNRHVND